MVSKIDSLSQNSAFEYKDKYGKQLANDKAPLSSRLFHHYTGQAC